MHAKLRMLSFQLLKLNKRRLVIKYQRRGWFTSEWSWWCQSGNQVILEKILTPSKSPYLRTLQIFKHNLKLITCNITYCCRRFCRCLITNTVYYQEHIYFSMDIYTGKFPSHHGQKDKDYMRKETNLLTHSCGKSLHRGAWFKNTFLLTQE